MASVYVDTNVVLDLFPARDTSRSHELRRLVRSSVKTQRIAVMLSGLLFQELARHARNDWSRFRRITRYLRDLGGEDLILDVPQLLRAEIRAGGRPLRGRSCFYPRADVRELYRAMSSQAYLASVEPVARTIAQHHETEEKQLRAAFQAHIASVTPPGKSITIGLREWWHQDPRARVRSLAEATLHQIAKEIAGVDLAADYPPERLPTFWRFHAFFVGRTYLRAAENARIQPSDYADGYHYALGGQADIFVTSDGPVRRVHEAIASVSDVRLVDVDTFADDLARR
jgi:hypothetical protein